jgi:transcriptional antiterminator
MIVSLKKVELPETPAERFLFTFIYLTFTNEPISVQNLADIMYVSKTVMIKTLKEIEEYLQGFNGLNLERTKKGLYFIGKEKNIRHILSETLNYKTYGSILMDKVLKFQFGPSYSNLYEILQNQLPVILYKSNLNLIDKSVEGFLLDIFIMIHRNKAGFFLKSEDNRQYPRVFEDIIKEIEKILMGNDIVISEDDRSFLKECLLTKRVLYKNCVKLEPREEAVELTEQFLSIVDEKYDSNYLKNLELKEMLCIHIDKMLYRLEQGHFEHNASVKNVKELYKRQTEMAAILYDLIFDKYGYKLQEEELGFIILYMGAFAQTKVKAIIISDIGQSVAESMAKQINNYCGDKIEIIGSFSLNYIRQFSIDVDVIFTPIRLFNVTLPIKTKVIYINYVLQEENIKRIQDFLINYDGGGYEG